MIGWISDFFRLAAGFLYWNTRKTFYRQRLKKGRGRCPCQHPSDSGRAWETGCAAMLHWNNPARFQRLCPLLKQNTAGAWRCSVNREEVRPFWGRAIRFYCIAALSFYLIATLTVFGFLRVIGYGVTYPGVLWPPAWRQFTPIRAEFFIKKYQTSAAAGDMKGAIMALSTGFSLDPANYAAGRQLAQFWQVTQPGLADQYYRQLLATHPAEAEQTAQSWFRALLARGDFTTIEALAAQRIQAVPDQSLAWINAFLFANRHTGSATARAKLETTPKLSAPAVFLLSLTADLQAANPKDTRARLIRAADEARDALSLLQVARLLLTRGFPEDALRAIDRRAGLLGARDMISVRLDALAALGQADLLRREIGGILSVPPNSVIIDLLSTHLIRYPNPELLDLVFARLERDPLPSVVASYPAYLSLFCAAGVARHAPHLQWSANRIRETLGAPFQALDYVAKSFLDTSNNGHIENYLPILQPLSLNVCYALFDHYSPVP